MCAKQSFRSYLFKQIEHWDDLAWVEIREVNRRNLNNDDVTLIYCEGENGQVTIEYSMRCSIYKKRQRKERCVRRWSIDTFVSSL